MGRKHCHAEYQARVGRLPRLQSSGKVELFQFRETDTPPGHWWILYGVSSFVLPPGGSNRNNSDSHFAAERDMSFKYWCVTLSNYHRIYGIKDTPAKYQNFCMSQHFRPLLPTPPEASRNEAEAQSQNRGRRVITVAACESCRKRKSRVRNPLR